MWRLSSQCLFLQDSFNFRWEILCWTSALGFFHHVSGISNTLYSASTKVCWLVLTCHPTCMRRSHPEHFTSIAVVSLSSICGLATQSKNPWIPHLRNFLPNFTEFAHSQKTCFHIWFYLKETIKHCILSISFMLPPTSIIRNVNPVRLQRMESYQQTDVRQRQKKEGVILW